MPPDRRPRNSAIVRVRWQRRIAAIPFGTVQCSRDSQFSVVNILGQAVIQQAADHFRLNDIIDELVLVAVIDDEELELTSNTIRLLAKDVVVALRCVAQLELGKEHPKSESPALPSTPARRLDRPQERPLKARSPSPCAESCKCAVCVRTAREHESAPGAAAFPNPPRREDHRDVKSEAFEDKAITIFVAVPDHARFKFTTRSKAIAKDIIAAVAQRLHVNQYSFALFSPRGDHIARIGKNTLFDHGIRDGSVLELRWG